ncbi:hypothetical protein hmeg3_23625 [Herbaspirillum sp. meg3]|jgi:hypothetical protein|uniref:MAC/perforin domain-containing protein n=1 Tax=Herbaspirillum sp. meg3 TaxID=2025949 RepID=UPI000B98017A|nr:MAC/perforin domain-containing protein [Herbaspirillum sp. meg3]ASU40994.1 hypothetical protein hmeg3_23625 [Herbaspirillum sp. meg3]
MHTESTQKSNSGDAIESIPGYALVGYGFDIFKAYDQNSIIKALFKIGDKGGSSITLGDKSYAVPENISHIPTVGKVGNTYLFSSREKVQKHFSTKADIEASAFGFSGHIEASYSHTSKSNQDYFYALTETSSTAYSLSLRDDSEEMLTDSFAKEMKKLPKKFTPENQNTFFAFFRKHGSHYVDKVIMGGRLYFSTSVSKSHYSSEEEVKLKVTAEYAGAFSSVKAESESNWKTLDQKWQQNRSVTVQATGGDDSILDALKPAFGQWKGDAFKTWNASLEQKPGIVDFKLAPISQLFPGDQVDEVALALKKYINGGIVAKAIVLPSHDRDYVVHANTSISFASRVVPVLDTMPKPPTSETWMAGAQLVLFDASTHQILLNKTLYAESMGRQVTDMYDRLYAEVAKFDEKAQEYYCALSIFGVFAPLFPRAKLAAWLDSCGAKMEQWKLLAGYSASDSGFVSYCMVGRSGQSGGAQEDLKLVPAGRVRANYEAVSRYFIYGKKMLSTTDGTHDADEELQEEEA